MDRDARLRLYGTDEAPSTPRRLSVGPLSVEVADGAVRSVAWHGTEVLRGIDYPVRDANWGTYSTATLSETAEENEAGFTYRRSFAVGDGLFSGTFTCAGAASGSLTATLRLHAERDAAVNRAGFVVLHPIAGVAGTPLRVTHGDRTTEETSFPELISPGQPLFDIAVLRQEANGVVAEISFSGETFEMEDQRNWSDASYKTYCRPLALPYPYPVAAGETVEQTITLTLSGTGTAPTAANGEAIRFGGTTGRTLPEPALALEPGWKADPAAEHLLQGWPILLRIDLTRSDWPDSLADLRSDATGALDLEVIVPDRSDDVDAALAALAGTGIAPRSVMALPAAYLKSYQPDAAWPTGATPEQAGEAARRHFPAAEIGGGMLTNFTELNRYRSAAGAGDFVTHGTTAIVHAADDTSVLQTLEALPQIFASAEALAPDKPYRLGLVSIGMRSNPYGAAVADNPDAVRRPMAMLDPRQRGLFAAAWMVGAVAATERSRVGRMALAAPGGPLGLLDGTRARPLFHVHKALMSMARRRRIAVSSPTGTAGVAVEGAALIANLSAVERRIALPAPARAVLLDDLQPSPDWLHGAPRATADSLHLPPFSVGFLLTGADDIFGREP